MIDSIFFIGHNGQTVELNTDTYPLSLFDMNVETETDERRRPSQHGLFPTYTYMGKRTFHMEGDIFAADSADFIVKRFQLIGPFIPSPEFGFRSSGVLAVKFTGLSETVTAECFLDGLPQAPIAALSPSRGTFVVSIQAFDPVLYGASLNSATTGVPGGNGGFVFPFVFPLLFTLGTGGGGDVNVTNSGNTPVYPTVVITGPCKDPSLSLTAYGQQYTLGFQGLDLSLGETLTVDFNSRTVLSDTKGSAYSFVVPGSDWWQIPPGTWTVSFRAFSSSIGCKATVKFSNAYMV